MCEDFDDRRRQDPYGRQRLSEGWLIQRYVPEDSAGERRYLQIGTGQWCGAIYATLFPVRETAITYAVEFGYEIGKTAQVVRFKRRGDESAGGCESGG